MPIKQKPFVRYHDEKQVDSFAVRLNKEQREILDKSKEILEQPKDSTALKQLALIGAKVIHEEKTKYLLAVIYANKRKNQRLGIAQY